MLRCGPSEETFAATANTEQRCTSDTFKGGMPLKRINVIRQLTQPDNVGTIKEVYFPDRI